MNPTGQHYSAGTGRYDADVRGEALWAGIAAGLLLYYGFGSGWTTTSTGTVLVDIATRGGGVAMVLSALLLLTGWRGALLFDGIASMIIGAALCLSVPFGLTVLYLIFGILFLASGWRNVRTYRDLRRLSRLADAGRAGTPADLPPQQSLASQLRRHENAPASSDPMSPQSPAGTNPVAVASADDEKRFEAPRQPSPPPASEPPLAEDAPEGFLASFADPPRDDQTR